MRLLLQSRGGRSVLTLPDDAPLHALRAAVHEKLGVLERETVLVCNSSTLKTSVLHHTSLDALVLPFCVDKLLLGCPRTPAT